ncbi:MAG: molybdopterin molybdotransferase MoeA, partial [Paracoccaceae bacterium]
LPVPEALSRILALTAPVGAERVPLEAAGGRVLAEPAVARRAQPPFRASAMDGWAARSEDVTPGAVLAEIGEAQAGRRFDGSVGPGEAVRIFTGAPVPPGADRILIQEDAERLGGGRIRVGADPDAGPHVRPAGVDFAEGATMTAPRRLTPEDVALLAAFDLAEVTVRRRPVVALIPTGDELVEPGEARGEDQIVSANSYGLAALLAAQGAAPRRLPIARDEPDSLRAALEAARDADLIVTLGGASVGDRDLVRAVGGEAGLELDFYRIAMRPGKPLLAGRLGGTPMVGLPGNPVSAMVCGRLFLQPAVDALLGLPAAAPPRLRAVLAGAIGPTGPREHYARARIVETPPDGPPCVEIVSHQDSSLLSVLSDADCLAVLPAGAGARAAGETVEIIPLRADARGTEREPIDTKRERR